MKVLHSWPAAVSAAAFVAVSGMAQALPDRASINAEDALARLRANAGMALTERRDFGTAYTTLHAARGQVLHADGGAGDAEDRARYFLSVYGAALGVRDPAADLALRRVSRDGAGNTHIHLDQTHGGLPVFGARLVVHMSGAGITGVSGAFVPNLHKLSTTPRQDVATLRTAILAAARKAHPNQALALEGGEFVVYPVGLLQGKYRGARLAYQATVVATDRTLRDRWFIDANTGQLLNQISQVETVKNREIYTPDTTVAPTLDESATTVITPAGTDGPPLINDPGHGSTATSDNTAADTPTNRLWMFAGGTYDLYNNMFGREGYDVCDGNGPCRTGAAAPWDPLRGYPATGQIQMSVYLVNEACPNAYWNGTSTNYCPGFDADDVVSHEWSHAYTQFTHGLIYQWQSGALNESYSDIFGEAYDLVNNLEGPLGSATLVENEYYEDFGMRWVVGEDLSEVAANLLLRDMWKPEDFPSANPGKVSSGAYDCGGEVHYNSSIPNHAFAMLVDGTAGQGPADTTGFERDSYNGQSFAGIGLVKAAHIYFHAEANYQTPGTTFAQHADALEQSCLDLIGVTLKDPAGANWPSTIAQADCDILHKDMLATEMRLLPLQCQYAPLLRAESTTPAICPAGSAHTTFSETWEGGMPGTWALASTGVNASSWDNVNWVATASLPAPHTGQAAFAFDDLGGDCSADDNSGTFSMTSPEVTLETGKNRLVFTHYIATEGGWDGGNVKYSVNGGAFAIVPPEAFLYNPYNDVLNPAVSDAPNTNPMADEGAWTGSDGGTIDGSWGTSIVDVDALDAVGGDKLKFRFEFGQDGCNGNVGWYVDNISVQSCPVLDPPVLSTDTDYEDPDDDGTYTLKWTRLASALGPDLLQKSTTSCEPMLEDDASSLTPWTATTTGTTAPAWTTSTAKPQHTNNSTFWAQVRQQDLGAGSATLTYKNPMLIPATGPTTLRFSEWYYNEDSDTGFAGDAGIVEISTDNGANWIQVYANTRSMGSTPDEGAAAMAGEDLTPTTVDLTPYAGQIINLRFRFRQDSPGYIFFVQYGWYIDDISVINDNWGDVLTTSTPSHTLTGQPNGTQCFRVRTAFDISGTLTPSPFSNIVTTTVDIDVPPIALAGVDFSVLEGTASGLDGRNSSDENGDTLAYSWSQLSGPAIALTGADTAQPTFTAPDVCTNLPAAFRLTVTANGLTATDDVVVTILNHNTAPAASAGADFAVGEGTSVMLSAAGTSDPDCETIDYSWVQVGGPDVVLSGADTATATFTAPATDEPIALLFRLTVTDAIGEATSDDVQVTVVNGTYDPKPAIGNNKAGALPALNLVVLGLLALRRRRSGR